MDHTNIAVLVQEYEADHRQRLQNYYSKLAAKRGR
jgi:hypothetical protein